MPSHSISSQDRDFRQRFEAGEIAPEHFDHRAHVRLAYVYVTELGTDGAHLAMRNSLLAFLERNGVETSKYHETITRAWILAIRHFMERTPGATSADDLIERNPELLDSKIMLSHYSVEALFGEEARAQFREPDKDPIPRYNE